MRLGENEVGQLRVTAMEGSAVHVDLFTIRGHVCWRIDRQDFSGREPSQAFIEDLHHMIDGYRLARRGATAGSEASGS